MVKNVRRIPTKTRCCRLIPGVSDFMNDKRSGTLSRSRTGVEICHKVTIRKSRIRKVDLEPPTSLKPPVLFLLVVRFSCVLHSSQRTDSFNSPTWVFYNLPEQTDWTATKSGKVKTPFIPVSFKFPLLVFYFLNLLLLFPTPATKRFPARPPWLHRGS